MLDEIYQKLCFSGGQSNCSEDGRPVYTLSFYGTKEEAEAIKKRLLELDPKQQ